MHIFGITPEEISVVGEDKIPELVLKGLRLWILSNKEITISKEKKSFAFDIDLL